VVKGTGYVNALENDPKFRDAFSDPDFKFACGEALDVEMRESLAVEEARLNMSRFYDEIRIKLKRKVRD
jgi:hypothetical protein